jgi:DNA-binding SARP family transcriptional activator
MAVPSAGTASICLLGGFDVRSHGRQVSVPVTAQRVLGYLDLTGARQSRDVVAGRLWQFTSQARAQANLRTALWQLRRTHRDVVQAARDRIWLTDGVAVDYHAMTEQARRLLSGAVDGSELTRVPLDLFQAELLPGWDEDWLLIERERHRQLRMHTLEDLSHRLARAGQFALAVDAAYAAIAIEPLCESAHRTLTEVFLAEGNRTEALRQFRLYRSLLADETGFGPTEEFAALLERPAARLGY